MKSDLGPQTGNVKDPASAACAGRALPTGMSVLGELGKAWTLRAPGRGVLIGLVWLPLVI